VPNPAGASITRPARLGRPPRPARPPRRGRKPGQLSTENVRDPLPRSPASSDRLRMAPSANVPALNISTSRSIFESMTGSELPPPMVTSRRFEVDRAIPLLDGAALPVEAHLCARQGPKFVRTVMDFPHTQFTFVRSPKRLTFVSGAGGARLELTDLNVPMDRGATNLESSSEKLTFARKMAGPQGLIWKQPRRGPWQTCFKLSRGVWEASPCDDRSWDAGAKSP